MNLGSLSLVLLIFFIKIIMIFTIFWPVQACFPSLRTRFIKMRRQLFFNDFFTIIFEGYFNIVLCCFFNYYAPDGSDDKNMTNTIISYFLLFMLMICVPSALLYILSRRPLSKLKTDEFKETWGMAYDGVHLSSRINLTYRLWFCLRRMVFISTLYVIPHYPALQLVIFLYTNLLTVIYQG